MRGFEPGRELRTELQDLALRHRSRGEPRIECLAGDALEHQEVHPVLGVEVVDGDDIGVVELGERQRLAAEALPRHLVGQRAGRQQLERDVALQALVMGGVDDAHAARADLLEHAIMAQRLADQAAASRL